MTDDVMKELVTKHDATISHLVSSVEHLVASQTVTNERLEEISKFLAKQVVFSTKLETMDKEISDSFKRRDEAKVESDRRIHARINEVINTQKSESGCGSVRMLTKDVESIARDVMRLIGNSEEHRINIETLDKKMSSYPSKGAILSVVIVIAGYMVIFGTYVTQTLNGLDKTNAKLTTLIERDIKDVAWLMEKSK